MIVRAGHVLLISSLAHGALVALVADRWAPLKWCVLGPMPAPADAKPAPTEPIEVAFIEPVREPEPESESVTEPVRIGAVHATIARTATANASETTSTSASTATSERSTTPGTSLLHMRGPDLHLDGGTAERIAGARPAEPRDELRKSGKLESAPGGGAVIHDRVTTMTVDPDGKAHFDDVPDIDVKFHLPIPKLWKVDELRRDVGHELAEWFKDPEAGKRFGRTQDLPRHLQATEGGCDSWTNLMCDDPLAPQIVQRARERAKKRGGFLGGATDITAYLHRKLVGDPYASRKLKLLDDTRDERVAMGTKHRAQQSVRSAEYMARNLAALWARVDEAIGRRAALFELWDECGEDDAGKRARAMVIGWIRTHLPAGSADAYTDEEVGTLNAHRTSSVTFAPYAD